MATRRTAVAVPESAPGALPEEKIGTEEAEEAAAAALEADEEKPQKQPPPEKASDVQRRRAVLISFWLVVLLLGLPIWWKTTSIYRASLPVDEMLEWADGRACRPVFPLRIAIQASSLQDAEANHLLRLTQHALDDLNDFSGHHLRLELSRHGGEEEVPLGGVGGDLAVPGTGDDVALTIRLRPGDVSTATLHPHFAILDVTYPANSIPPLSSSSSVLTTFIAAQLRSTFEEEQTIISYLLSASSSTASSAVEQQQQQQQQQRLAPEVAMELAKRTTRSLKYAPTYHLTFSLFTSGPSPSSWDIEGAIAEYMQPVLTVLSPIHNFTMDTQVQLYATPGAQAQVLSKEDLSSFINAAEWPLSPSIAGAPTINFVVFVGNQTIDVGGGPLGQTSQSWLVPQWGAVYLLQQPASGDETHVSQAALREPLLTFTAHLLSLLGTPQSGSLPLRLWTLSRIRSADLLLRASSTLGSLARLSLALRNIAIPPSVAEGVASTMRHLRLACDSLGGADGLAHARIAEAEAERAFFEKSMVGQLYFPDEHKVAVYLPLLGPVGVPLVMGLLNEIKAWLRRRKERAAAAADKKKE
ncbi:GPI transamidase component [Grosmannia clavigera kw1407]|uniref:GPI transamidase component n=1 Tax=Grosmannia clavigera (strain kw1407 / UAMH 11150) TaxID=655863 RepID=F0XIQ9_GROCL|nr:GPI transamidase component [Grosmannia clavigera kw1407]EFX02206.1 GPI transamidase component [Grosmannia clavigera kw1407]